MLQREDGALREAIRRELRAAEGLPERPKPRKGARVLAPWTDGTLYVAKVTAVEGASVSMAVNTSPAMIGRDMTIKMIFGLICHRFE